MTQQPILSLLSKNLEPFEYQYDQTNGENRNFAVGAYYVSTLSSLKEGKPKVSDRPGLYFSYNFHTDHVSPIIYQPAVSVQDYRLVKFADLSVAVQQPNNYYRLGYSIIRRVDIANSSFSYQCSFNSTNYDVWIDPDYKFTYTGFHVVAGIPLLVISVTLLSVLSLCCVNKFAITKHNRSLLLKDEEEEQYFDEIHTEMCMTSKEKEGFKQKKKDYQDFIIYKHRRNFFGETLFKKPIPNSETNSFDQADDEEKFTDLKSKLKHNFTISLLFDTQLVNQCGTDVYYYMWFSKYLIVYVVVCGLVACGSLLPTYLTTTDYNVSFGDFSSTSIANMSIKTNDKIYVFFLVTIAFPILGLVFIYGLNRLSRQLIKSRTNIGSLYTVMVNGISRSVRDRKKLLEDFKQRYGDCVVDAHLALDLNNLSELDEKREDLERMLRGAEREYEKSGRRPQIKVKGLMGFFGKKVDAIEEYSKALESVNKEINILRLNPNKTIHGTGYGFVTFSTMDDAQRCLNEHKDINCCCGISIPWWLCSPSGWGYGGIERAPEPDDVLFENLSIGSTNRWVRSLISSAVITSFLLLIYAISTTVSWYYWYKGQNYSSVKDYFIDTDASVIGVDTLALVLMVLAELLPEAVSLTNEIVKPVIEVLSDYEKHPSRTSRRKTILRKTIFFITLSIMIFPFFIRWIKAVWGVSMNADFPFNNYAYFFNFIGTEVATLIMALCTIAKSLEYTFMFIIIMVKYRFSDNGNGNRELERLPFDYEANIGVKIAILMLTLLYGSAVPCMFAFSLIYYVVTYYLDKYLILYFFEKAPDSDGTLMRTTSDTLAYYLSIYPILVIFMIPSLASLWSTWLIYLPTIFVFYMVVRIVRNRMSRSEMDMLVVSLSSMPHDDIEKQEEVDINAGDSLEMEVTDSASPSSPISIPQRIPVKNGIATSSIRSLMSFVAGEEQVVSIYDKEVEKRLDVDQRKQSKTKKVNPNTPTIPYPTSIGNVLKIGIFGLLL
ncbi:predicted protein [Naegleria gruberi]|uniref:Predicted protein n=1 Tax=Naegleria gruberi TaxID=5762 RepID=D2V8W1_NAEGR|nr:uncharacterized protein NAEGRDRAFT_65302 [Naegleria gruberi]EFC46760.1 predicted protein [Naegleria gruberi]|eukprot:XP_002679504.1 predicted protein [Naegleria gruberi strain NEG-M]